MKVRLVDTLVGLAISFAVPAFAQDKDTVDPEVRQQIEAIYMTNVDAHNKHEAAAVAALYTEDAVQVRAWESEGGLATGQQAIEKRFAVELASSPGEYIDKLVQVYPVGDEICAISQWSWEVGKGYYARIFNRKRDRRKSARFSGAMRSRIAWRSVCPFVCPGLAHGKSVSGDLVLARATGAKVIGRGIRLLHLDPSSKEDSPDSTPPARPFRYTIHREEARVFG
jgi:ketosteroid isomerase-like protein